MRQGSLLLCMAVSPRGRGVSPRIADSAPGLRILRRGRGFCAGAAGFTPGARVLLLAAGCSYIITGGGSCTGPCRRGGVRALFKQDARILCRGGEPIRFGQGHPAPLPGVGERTGPFQTGRTGPLPGWLTVRKAPKGRGGRHSPRGAKEKSVFTRKIRYFFLFLHQLGK